MENDGRHRCTMPRRTLANILTEHTSGPERNAWFMITLGFRSDLGDLNERNRRNSCAILKVSQLKIGQRWPEDEMHKCSTYFFTDHYGESATLSCNTAIFPMMEIPAFFAREKTSSRSRITVRPASIASTDAWAAIMI